MVPLSTEVATGDEVEIITSAHQTPHQDWLQLAKTSRARSKIRQFFRQKHSDEAQAIGRDLIEREAAKLGFQPPTPEDLKPVAEHFSLGTTDALLAGLGHGMLSLQQIMPRLYPQLPARKQVPRSAPEHRPSGGIRVQGMGHMMFRFGQCCHPVPGDAIVGFITRGRGITIHRRNCKTALAAADAVERKVEVDWDVKSADHFLVKLLLFVDARRDLLRDLTAAVADAHANVRGAEVDAAQGMASVVVEVQHLEHLDVVITRLKLVKGVRGIERERVGE
jgi:guanosine-3',5'-bis(diphosphate) 3'-pyrophosphohydrolase